MPWQQWAVISLWEETRPRRIDCRMEGNNGDFRQYHITEAGFCHFNCNTQLYGDQISHLYHAWAALHWAETVSRGIWQNSWDSPLLGKNKIKDSDWHSCPAAWRGLMIRVMVERGWVTLASTGPTRSTERDRSWCLSLSAACPEGGKRLGVENICWHYESATLTWDWDITLCPPFIPPFIWLPMLRDILPTSPLRLALPFSWRGDPIPLCSCLACCKAVAKEARPG